jgi:hypothetical protein
MTEANLKAIVTTRETGETDSGFGSINVRETSLTRPANGDPEIADFEYKMVGERDII